MSVTAIFVEGFDPLYYYTTSSDPPSSNLLERVLLCRSSTQAWILRRSKQASSDRVELDIRSIIEISEE